MSEFIRRRIFLALKIYQNSKFLEFSKEHAFFICPPWVYGMGVTLGGEVWGWLDFWKVLKICHLKWLIDPGLEHKKMFPTTGKLNYGAPHNLALFLNKLEISAFFLFCCLVEPNSSKWRLQKIATFLITIHQSKWWLNSQFPLANFLPTPRRLCEFFGWMTWSLFDKVQTDLQISSSLFKFSGFYIKTRTWQNGAKFDKLWIY